MVTIDDYKLDEEADDGQDEDFDAAVVESEGEDDEDSFIEDDEEEYRTPKKQSRLFHHISHVLFPSHDCCSPQACSSLIKFFKKSS